MSGKLTRLLFLILVLGVTGSAFSAVVSWDDGDPCDSLWSSPQNWADDVKPGISDYARFDGSGHIEGMINSTESIFSLRVGYDGATTDATLNITTDSNLTTTGDWAVGYDVNSAAGGSVGVINMDDGVATCGGVLYVGHDGTGTINVSGGTLTANSTMVFGYWGTATLNITGGSVSSTGDIDFGNADCNISNDGSLSTSKAIFLARCDGTSTLSMTGGTVSSNLNMILGEANGDTAVWNISGGSATCSSALYVGLSGTGTINVSGSGTLTLSGEAKVGGHGSTGIGTLNIDGGSVSGASIKFGGVGVGDCNISNGSLSSSTELLFGVNNGSGTLKMTGGTVSSSGVTLVGNNGSGTAVWNMDGGTFTGGTGDTVIGHAGTGTLNMTGGTINCPGAYFEIGREGTGVGDVQLDGGTINAKSFRMRLNGGVGTMDITEGVMNVEGDWVAPINGYITNGWLTAYEGHHRAVLHVEYDTAETETHVWAEIPDDVNIAWNPDPADGNEMSESTALGNPVLTWSPGDTAVQHDVYFGIDNDVNDANTSTPAIYKGRQDPCSYEPGALEIGETYYWRIDEVESDGVTIHKGDIWEFTVNIIGDFDNSGMVNMNDLAILADEWLRTTTVVSWENDMSVDPVGNGWVVRNDANDYTISGGLMDINEGLWTTVVDSTPDNDFVGQTDIELTWRATSITTSGNMEGVGLWINVNHDTDDFGNLSFQAVLTDASSQEVSIYNNNSELTYIDGFDNSMLSMTATIDANALTISYEITDGTTTKNDVVAYVTAYEPGNPHVATIFTAKAAGEIDYFKIVNTAPLVPMADTDGNDFVNFYDFAKMASEWLMGTERTLWMCPNPNSCDDYIQLFEQPYQWPGARKYVKVFATYDHRLELFANSEVALIATKLKQWHIDFAFESGAIKEWGPNGDLTADLTLRVLDSVKANGGSVKYIAMDEPYWAGIHHIGTYDMQQSLDKTIHYINRIKTEYPEIIIGDIEPYPAISKNELEEWITAFGQQTGEEFPFFHIDVNRNEPDYDVQDVKQLQQFCRGRGIEFGVIFNNPYYNSTTNCEFYNGTLNYANHIISNMGMPDQAIIQSWMPWPDRVLPEDVDCSFTRLIKDFAMIYLQ